MKQMPVESFFVAFGRPIPAAMRRTSRLLQRADREERARELRLGEAVQEIALVLLRVEPLQQLEARRPLRAPERSARSRCARRRAASRGRGTP